MIIPLLPKSIIYFLSFILCKKNYKPPQRKAKPKNKKAVEVLEPLLRRSLGVVSSAIAEVTLVYLVLIVQPKPVQS